MIGRNVYDLTIATKIFLLVIIIKEIVKLSGLLVKLFFYFRRMITFIDLEIF